MRVLILYKAVIELNNIILVAGDRRVTYRDKIGEISSFPRPPLSAFTQTHYSELNSKEVK